MYTDNEITNQEKKSDIFTAFNVSFQRHHSIHKISLIIGTDCIWIQFPFPFVGKKAHNLEKGISSNQGSEVKKGILLKMAILKKGTFL